MESENKELYKFGEKKIKELNIELWNNINNLKFDVSFKEKFYLLENSIFEVPKCECGNSVKFIDMHKGYRNFCSKRCMYDSDTVKNNKRKTCIEKWGVDNPSKSNKIKEKIKETNLEKFGVEYPLQNEEIKEKTKNKFIENWGVDNPSKVKEVRDKAKSTMVERFGVEHAMYSDIIKDKLKDKFIENWGVDNPSKVKEVRDKARETMVERFGVEYALQNNDIFEKMLNNNIEKWGFEYYSQTDEYKEKFKKTCIENWGVDNYSKTDEYKDKIRKTSIKNWGVDNPSKSEKIKEKIKNTNTKKYGYDHISKNCEYRTKYKISNHKNYINYIGDGISLFSCDKNINHTFEIHIDNFIKRLESNNPICTICNPIGDLKSIKEKELYLFTKSIYDGEIIQSYRDGLEIDIYLPELKIGLEFNGLYWHSEFNKDKNYHIDKTKYFEDRGIRIIHIWEDDWTLNREIVKSQIMNWVGLSKKIFARKCILKKISNTESKKFLSENHIQGYVNSIYSIGLYFEDELVSIMNFDKYEGRNKMGNNEWNLNRFCNKINTNVIGGASKLLKHFIKENNPVRIISYADRDWSLGNLYYKLGFNLIKKSKPDYKYILNDKRVHKSKFRKSNNKLDITESEYTKMNNIYKIWDCGKLKFEMMNPLI